MRAFRFGVVFTGSYSSEEWRRLARRVEDLGFSTLLVADHYMNPMACGPLMMMAAEATTSLRVGSYVYNNDFRPPALLAKEVATIDVLSGGRFEEWTWQAHQPAAGSLRPIADAASHSRFGVNLSHVFGRFRIAAIAGVDVAILVRHVDSPVYAWRLN